MATRPGQKPKVDDGERNDRMVVNVHNYNGKKPKDESDEDEEDDDKNGESPVGRQRPRSAVPGRVNASPTPGRTQMKRKDFTKRDGQFFKVDDEHGIAFGWAIVSTIGGEPYFDTQGDHIPMNAVYKAAERFMQNSRAGDEQHDERRAGDVVFCMPVDTSLAKSLFNADTDQEGLVIGFKPYDKKLLGKIKRGERRGFSIGGTLARYTTKSIAKFAPRGFTFAKGYEPDVDKERRVFEDFEIDFISSVDWPAQEGALVTIVKAHDYADDGDEVETVMWMRKGVMPPKKPGGFGGGKPGAFGGQPQQQMKPMTPPQPMVGPNQNPMGNMGMSPPTAQPGAAMGGSLPVEPPKLTGDSDGHQHAISMADVGEDGVGYTGFGISANGISHRHAFVVHPDGNTEIAVNNGHTHNSDGTPDGAEIDPETGELIEPELDEMGNPIEPELGGEPTDEGLEDEGVEGDDGPAFGAGDMGGGDEPPDEKIDEKKKPKPGASPFAPRKRAHDAGQNGKPGLASVTKEHAMDPAKQIAALKKQLADATAYAKLNDAEKAYHASLDAQDQAVFLSKSATDRKADIAKALDADPLVYTCDDGTEIRKSHGQIAERQARKFDELNVKYAKQANEAEQLKFEKRAGAIMKHYPKTIAAKAGIVRAIEKATESVDKDGKPVVNAELRKEMMDILSAGDKALSKSYTRFGKSANVDPTEDDGDDPTGKLEQLAKEYAKEHKVSFAKAYEAVLETDEGAELYAEQDAAGPNGSPALDDFDDDDNGDFEVVEDGDKK